MEVILIWQIGFLYIKKAEFVNFWYAGEWKVGLVSNKLFRKGQGKWAFLCSVVLLGTQNLQQKLWKL